MGLFIRNTLYSTPIKLGINKPLNVCYPFFLLLQQEKGMKSKSTLLLLVFVLSFTNSAFAYLDPGSGSYILQMLIAGILGSLYAIKLYWAKIVNFFKGNSSIEDDSLEDSDDE